MDWKFALILASLFVALMWFFRWDTTNAPNSAGISTIYMVNRITGEVRIVQSNKSFLVEEHKPAR